MAAPPTIKAPSALGIIHLTQSGSNPAFTLPPSFIPMRLKGEPQPVTDRARGYSTLYRLDDGLSVPYVMEFKGFYFGSSIGDTETWLLNLDAAINGCASVTIEGHPIIYPAQGGYLGNPIYSSQGLKADVSVYLIPASVL